jgi:NAD(P)-dependent dehydrogenase (short-subunit alcohol dehydrogenase family)
MRPWKRVARKYVEGEDLMAKTWFITGASKGFGREWTEAALERGDKVAATARNLETLEALVKSYGDAVLPIQLDVTDRAADFDAVRKAADSFGQLDVVINNAGFGHFGAIEELSEDDVRSQLETNLFGALWVTQAALPIMRAQGSGHIIQVSSIGGVTAFPTVGAYHASKWALEGFSQALSQEVADFGIKVTLVEPGGYSTDWAGPSAKHSRENPAYSGVREARNRSRAATPPGDPTATRTAILKVVDADKPPLRIFFGKVPLGVVTADYESRLATWNQWQPISVEAQGSE